MGGSTFVFIESKTFEFAIEEGGSFFLLHIYERGRNSIRSICMGKESAKRILFHIEELISKQKLGQFARTVREGDRVLILQLVSNAHGTFLLFSELDNGHRRGSIVISEGKSGSGWRGFGMHLRKTILLIIQATGAKQARATFKPVRVMEKFRQNLGGFGDKGKEISLGFQNLKSQISWGGNSGTNKVHVGADVTSVTPGFNGVADKDVNSSLVLDITLHVERGDEGK